ncbi:MAG: TlpA family protein disulfide reductase [Bacteroidales bacterium]|jgi:peroxiredoxin|nr:TlpA family protein disulfide reductase [Bacteroidales bacterium]
MTKKIFFITILLSICYNIFSQYSINIKIVDYQNQEIVFCSQFGDESKIISNYSTDSQGHFTIKTDSLKIGLYRIYLQDDSAFDFIFNNENISLESSVSNLVYNMKILQSTDNKQLYQYYKTQLENDNKIEILNQLLDVYPESNFKKQAETELNSLKKEQKEILSKAIKINPKSFAGRYLSCYKEFVIPENISIPERTEYINKNYWNNYTINDIDLINSDAYNQLVINFLKLQIQKRPTAEIYYNGAKTILNTFRTADKKIFNFVFEYILSGFESMELTEEIEKLSFEFADFCSDDDTDNTLVIRLKNHTNFKIGAKVPEFSETTINNKKIDLVAPLNKKTMIIFWASWCEHCAEMLPNLAKEKDFFSKNNLDVITISLDKYEENLNNFISENNIPFDVICDFKSWENKIVKDYFIYGTPFIIIVDENLQIIAKPYNENQIFEFVKRK